MDERWNGLTSSLAVLTAALDGESYHAEDISDGRVLGLLQAVEGVGDALTLDEEGDVVSAINHVLELELGIDTDTGEDTPGWRLARRCRN